MTKAKANLQVIDLEKTTLSETEKTEVRKSVSAIVNAQKIIDENKKIVDLEKEALLQSYNENATYTCKTGKFTVAHRAEAVKTTVDAERLINELPLIAPGVLEKLIEAGIRTDKTTPASVYITTVKGN